MASSSKPKNVLAQPVKDSPVEPSGILPSRPPRKTKWWAYVGLVLTLVLAYPAWRYNVYNSRLNGALSDLVQGDPEAAISKLELEQKAQPNNAEIVYWLKTRTSATLFFDTVNCSSHTFSLSTRRVLAYYIGRTHAKFRC